MQIQLPGVVQRIPAGHRIEVVLASSDSAYDGNQTAQPVTVRTGPHAPSKLQLPLTGGRVRFK